MGKHVPLTNPDHSIVSAPVSRRSSLVGEVSGYRMSEPERSSGFENLGIEYVRRAATRPVPGGVRQPSSPLSNLFRNTRKLTNLLSYALDEFDEATTPWAAVQEKLGKHYRNAFRGMHEMFPTEAAKITIVAAAKELLAGHGSRDSIPKGIEHELNGNFRNLGHARSPTQATGWVLPGSPDMPRFVAHVTATGGGLISKEGAPTQSESDAVHVALKGIVLSAFQHEIQHNPEGTTQDLTTTLLSAAVRSTQQQFFPPFLASNVAPLLQGAPRNATLTAQSATEIRNDHTRFIDELRDTSGPLRTQPANAPMSRTYGGLARQALGLADDEPGGGPPTIALLPASPIRQPLMGDDPPALSLAPPPRAERPRKRSAKALGAPVEAMTSSSRKNPLAAEVPAQNGVFTPKRPKRMHLAPPPPAVDEPASVLSPRSLGRGSPFDDGDDGLSDLD
ncbi:MAG TPA: hypothetical protein VFA39_10430 [Steroidobacteraceae bacterium]|nr:hypothetical protein [Steroidobacteraceae bacterium]